MVLAKFILDKGKKIFLGALANRLLHSKHEIAYEKDNLVDKIKQYRVTTPTGDYPIAKIAERDGLLPGLENYAGNRLANVQNYLSELEKLTNYIMNFSVAQQKGTVNESHLYAAVSRAYNIMSKLMGYSIIDERKKKYGYLSDIVTYMHEIGNMNKKLDRFLEIASGFDTHGSKFIYATSKRTLRWLSQQIVKKEGIPFAGLEAIVNPITLPFAELKKKTKNIFVEYESVVKSFSKAYASDFNSGVYGVVG